MKTQAGVYWDRFRARKINMKAALKWVLQDENVHTTIPAFSNFQEMEEDLSVMGDLELTPEEKRDIELGDSFEAAVENGRVVICTDEVDREYLKAVLSQANPGPRDLQTVYSPLDGVGDSAAGADLRVDGFSGV